MLGGEGIWTALEHTVWVRWRYQVVFIAVLIPLSACILQEPSRPSEAEGAPVVPAEVIVEMVITAAVTSST